MVERTAWEGWALGLVVRHGTPRTSNRLTTNGGGLGMGVTESGATVGQFLDWFPGVGAWQVGAVLEHEAEALRVPARL